MKKLEPPRIGAAVSDAVRTALKRVRGDRKPAAPARRPPVPATETALDVAEERAASRDLLAIDGLVRRFYAASSGVHGPAEWQRFRSLFHERASMGTGRPDPTSVTGLDDVPVERFIEVARGSGSVVRYAERSRTVHVLGDLAVVISSFEAEHGDAAIARGVHLMHLRLAPGGGWLIQSVIARSDGRAITEKSADPRPLAMRRRSNS